MYVCCRRALAGETVAHSYHTGRVALASWLGGANRFEREKKNCRTDLSTSLLQTSVFSRPSAPAKDRRRVSSLIQSTKKKKKKKQ
jgi:hypothetical protein